MQSEKSLTMEFVPFCKQTAGAFQLDPNHPGNAPQLAVQGGTYLKLRKHPHPDRPLQGSLHRPQWHTEGKQKILLESVGMWPFKIMRIHYQGLLALPFASNALQSAICRNFQTHLVAFANWTCVPGPYLPLSPTWRKCFAFDKLHICFSFPSRNGT